MALPTKEDLVKRIGMSVDYWDEQCAKQAIPHLRIGRKIHFTEQHIDEIIAMYEVRPKTVPTRDQLAAKRSMRRAA